MHRLLAVALLLYAAGLLALPSLRTQTQLWLFAGLFQVAGGFITVIFFAFWSHLFGQAQLGRIQGAAQMLTVFASALGPLLFAQVLAATGSYAPLLRGLTLVVLKTAFAAWFVQAKPHPSSPDVPA